MPEIQAAQGLMEKLVLNEIAGKNLALHAYDTITWKIRTGFLTLLLGGWSILLNGIVENAIQHPQAYRYLAWSLYAFSLGFTAAAWYVDRSYVRRKFRVIMALNKLTEKAMESDGDYRKIPIELLQVSGDSGSPYNSPPYREASRAEFSVYFTPPLIILGVLLFVL